MTYVTTIVQIAKRLAEFTGCKIRIVFKKSHSLVQYSQSCITLEKAKGCVERTVMPDPQNTEMISKATLWLNN